VLDGGASVSDNSAEAEDVAGGAGAAEEERTMLRERVGVGVDDSDSDLVQAPAPGQEVMVAVAVAVEVKVAVEVELSASAVVVGGASVGVEAGVEDSGQGGSVQDLCSPVEVGQADATAAAVTKSASEVRIFEFGFVCLW